MGSVFMFPSSLCGVLEFGCEFFGLIMMMMARRDIICAHTTRHNVVCAMRSECAVRNWPNSVGAKKNMNMYINATTTGDYVRRRTTTYVRVVVCSTSGRQQWVVSGLSRVLWSKAVTRPKRSPRGHACASRALAEEARTRIAPLITQTRFVHICILLCYST